MSFNEEEQERINDMVGALISATPERFTSIECSVAQVPAQCSGRYSYHISCEACPDEVITEPTEELHKAAYELIQLLNAEGVIFSMEQKEGGWAFNMQTAYLDTEDIDAERKHHDEEIWQQVYDERESFYRDIFGTIPEDINKLMTVHWPGGGFIDIQECKLIPGTRVLATNGLTNPDLPSCAFVSDFERGEESEGNVTFNTRLARKVPPYVPPEWAGYGYEVAVILADPEDSSAMGVLTWIAEGELNNDGNYFGRLQINDGLTVQDMKMFDGTFADFLFYPALEPVPYMVQLPNGLMHMVIATRITRAERDYAKETSCADLTKKLLAAGIGQKTDFKRASVI